MWLFKKIRFCFGFTVSYSMTTDLVTLISSTFSGLPNVVVPCDVESTCSQRASVIATFVLAVFISFLCSPPNSCNFTSRLRLRTGCFDVAFMCVRVCVLSCGRLVSLHVFSGNKDRSCIQWLLFLGLCPFT